MDSRQLEIIIDERDLCIIIQNNLKVSKNGLRWLVQKIEY